MTNLLLSSELLLIPQSSLDQVIICTRLDWIVLFFCIRRHSIDSIALPFIFNLISVSVAYNLVLDYAKVLDSLSFISSLKRCTTILFVCVRVCIFCVTGLGRFQLLAAFVGSVAGRWTRSAPPGDRTAGSGPTRQGPSEYWPPFFPLHLCRDPDAQTPARSPLLDARK